ncbi:MAG: oxidative damage protection protein [Chloracidobacterium sp.]|nr:oxidative damage protection protein [Chloracidobacterium sp.]MCO5333926.1 oxidative damage protection protein [Pyrinomonadaceae bacterium]
MALFSNKFVCKRCGNKGEQLKAAPVPNEIGRRIVDEICTGCWQAWLQKQTQLINHFGIDVMDPKAQQFLFDNLKGFLFDEGAPGVPLTQIDTSKKGNISW